MLHQHPSPVLRVVCLTAAVLGKQCENKKVMKRPMNNRLKNILAALLDIISIRERKKKEGMDEEIVLVLSFFFIAHRKKNLILSNLQSIRRSCYFSTTKPTFT